MITTWYDEAMQRGELKARREMLLDQLRARFKVTEDVRAVLESCSTERLKEISLALLSAKSLKELGLES